MVSPDCPRCGYDLRGAMSTWRGAWPLLGTCTECGLDFEWAQVLSPSLGEPGWCVEYAEGVRSFLVRSVRTLLRTFWPWGFWGPLNMSHEIRWRRIAGYLLLLVAGVYVTLALSHAMLAYAKVGGTRWTLYAPTGVTMRAGSVGWGDCLVAGLNPLSGSPIGGAGQSSRSLFVNTWALLLPPFVGLMLVHFLCAAGFVALPVSRRIARVEWGHIFRIAVYGLGLLFPLVTMTLGGAALSAQAPAWMEWPGGMLLSAAGVYALALPLAEIVWWSTATGRYLKIAHAWGVGIAVVMMAVLGTLVVLTWRYALGS